MCGLAEVLEEPDVVGAVGAILQGDLTDPIVGRATHVTAVRCACGQNEILVVNVDASQTR